VHSSFASSLVCSFLGFVGELKGELDYLLPGFSLLCFVTWFPFGGLLFSLFYC